MEQSDAAAGQSTAQEGGAEVTPGDESKPESDYSSANDEIQQQLNVVIWGKEMGEANKTEFDLEDLSRCQNPNGSLYTQFHGRSNTYSGIDTAYTSTKFRVGVKIDHEINTFSDHFQTIVIKREPENFKKGKGYWILNCGLLQHKEYIQEIKELDRNWQTQENYFRSISEWWEKGKENIKAFTNLYTRADITA